MLGEQLSNHLIHAFRPPLWQILHQRIHGAAVPLTNTLIPTDPLLKRPLRFPALNIRCTYRGVLFKRYLLNCNPLSIHFINGPQHPRQCDGFRARQKDNLVLMPTVNHKIRTRLCQFVSRGVCNGTIGWQT